MIQMTQSLKQFLQVTNRLKLASMLMFGHIEEFTPEIQKEYLEWCKTDEGRSYLKGGANYKEEENPS